jgi:enterochelin esterase-like enzyme
MNILSRLVLGAFVILSLVSMSGAISADDPPKDGKADPLADGDYKIGPTYTDAPELKVKPDVPKGKRFNFTMMSEESKMFPGLRGPYKRNVSVYVPSQYVAGTPAPFIVIHDAMASGQMSRLLDNMIAEKRLPVMVAIFVPSGGCDSKGSERGLEYDTVSGKYAEYIESEVLPRVEKEAKVTLTKDPEGRATMGGSSGAAAAFSMAWWHPELYRRVLSYSGTYVNQQSPDNPKSPHGAWEYHENLIPKSDAKPLRVWLQVGEKDNGYKLNEASLHNWVMANDRMAAALKAKGYRYRYVFCAGAGHVDGKAVNETLPGAMLWLWQGYPIK